MNILHQRNLPPGGFGNRRRSKRAFATIIFISLLAIMVLLAAANTMALIHLHREVKLLEQTQIKRLNRSQTNSIPFMELAITNLNSK